MLCGLLCALAPPLFHSIPLSSPVSHTFCPAVSHLIVFSFLLLLHLFYSLPFSTLMGNLFYTFHSCLPSRINPSSVSSVFLLALYLCIFFKHLVCLSANPHVPVLVLFPFSPTQPFQPYLHPSPSVPVPNEIYPILSILSFYPSFLPWHAFHHHHCICHV